MRGEHILTLDPDDNDWWLCTCGFSTQDDEEARAHIFEPAYDPAQSQWRP